MRGGQHPGDRGGHLAMLNGTPLLEEAEGCSQLPPREDSRGRGARGGHRKGHRQGLVLPQTKTLSRMRLYRSRLQSAFPVLTGKFFPSW